MNKFDQIQALLGLTEKEKSQILSINMANNPSRLYKEGEAYKVTVFRRSGLRRKLKPETYLLQEENGNLFMNTGFRIDVSYNEATDVLTFSPGGDYVRVKPQPGHPTEE